MPARVEASCADQSTCLCLPLLVLRSQGGGIWRGGDPSDSPLISMASTADAPLMGVDELRGRLWGEAVLPGECNFAEAAYTWCLPDAQHRAAIPAIIIRARCKNRFSSSPDLEACKQVSGIEVTAHCCPWFGWCRHG